MKLYSKKECPFCWQVKIALAFHNIDYELVEWDVPPKQDILKISPQGTVPVLVDDDITIWDSIPAIYYLEDIRSGDKTLFPGDNACRTKARLMLSYANSLVGPSLREVIFEKRNKPESDWQHDRIIHGSMAWLENLAWLENEKETGENFLSTGFSLADLALIPRFGLAKRYGVAVTDNYPQLYQWFNKIESERIYEETKPWL